MNQTKVEEKKKKKVHHQKNKAEEVPLPKTIGVESINIIIDTLESVSVKDILLNENPDISTVTNNLLAIS